MSDRSSTHSGDLNQYENVQDDHTYEVLEEVQVKEGDGEIREEIKEVVTEVREEIEEVVTEVREEVTEVVNEVREEIEEVRQQYEEVADEVREVVAEVREEIEEAREEREERQEERDEIRDANREEREERRDDRDSDRDRSREREDRDSDGEEETRRSQDLRTTQVVHTTNVQTTTLPHAAFDGAGQNVGLEIWRIENFEPVKISSDSHGTFNSGDCYIVLSTKTRPGSNRFQYDLHFWLGVDCSQDEAGAVALRTVELDETKFGGAAVQYREVQAHETKLFLSYFKKNIRYFSGGVDSGFRHIDTNSHEKRLFQIKGRKNIRIAEVPCMCGSLNQGDTFVLLTNQNIYVWIGPKSTDKEKTSGLLYARRVRDEEYGGRAHIHVVEDWNTNAAFFRALGSRDKVIKAADDHDDEDIIRKLDQATLLYEIYDEQYVREVSTRPFRQSMLNHEKCYILDSGPTGMFLWTGRDAPGDTKRSCWRRVQEFMDVRGYPFYLPVVRVVDGAETPIFQQYFDDWEDQPLVNGSDTRHVAEQDYDGVRDVNVAGLHRQTSKTEAWMPDDGSGTLRVWRIEDHELVPVPEKAHGVFFGGDCYVINYTYGQDSHIIYFWQGTKSTPEEKGAAAFQAAMVDESLGGKAVQIRVVQHKEPAHFLKIFRGRLVYFMGGHIRGFRSLKDYEDFDPRQPQMFQIRGSENAMRAMQVQTRAASLNSNDVFVVDAERKTFIWVGRYASPEELLAARRMLKHMSPEKGEPNVMEEGRESGVFWHVIGGEEGYYRIQKRSSLEVHIEPRLFHCSMTSGKFTVEEIVGFTQEDLFEGDVMLLDTFDEIFVWVGKLAKEFEKMESYKTARAYLQVDPSGRTSENTLIIVVKQGFETPQFSGCFPAWDTEKWSKGQTYQEMMEELGRENTGISLLENEMDKYTSFYTYDELRRRVPPEGVDPSRKEMYLTDDDFAKVFGMEKEAYKRLPEWKRIGLKKQHSLF